MYSAPGPAERHILPVTSQERARAAWLAGPPTAAEVLRYARQEGELVIAVTGHQNIGVYPGGVDAFCRHVGYQRSANVDPYLRDAASLLLSWEYITTRAGPGNSGDYITRARRTILFRGGDCVREK